MQILRRRSRTGENLRILRVKGRKRILPHAGSAEKEAGTAAPEAEDSGADIDREKRGMSRIWNEFTPCVIWDITRMS